MILLIKDTTVLATHDDTQPVTFDMYPSATAIKTIPDGTPLPEDGTDPTLADPSLVLDMEYKYIEDWPTETLRTKRLYACRLAANEYTEKYDIGSKLAFQAKYSILLKKMIAGALTPADVQAMTALESVMEWIDNVLSYYYSTKQQLEAAADNSSIDTITWDFSQFDATDPSIKLEDFYA